MILKKNDDFYGVGGDVFVDVFVDDVGVDDDAVVDSGDGVVDPVDLAPGVSNGLKINLILLPRIFLGTV